MFNLLTTFAIDCTPKTFLGLIPWYNYLDLRENNGACEVVNFRILPGDGGAASDIPLVLLAVVDDMLRLAGLIAVIFVVYGGIMYATSQGEPDKAKQAQSTIINALVGLAISIVAVAFVGFLGNKLG
jgi:hypothetical protein